MKSALIRMTCYGAASIVGALFAVYGVLAAAAHAVRLIPTETAGPGLPT